MQTSQYLSYRSLQERRGGPGCLSDLLKEEKRRMRRRRKKRIMRKRRWGKRRDEEKVQDSLVVEEGMMAKFPLVPLPLVITAANISKQSPACVNTSWWSMEPAVPPKYCKRYAWLPSKRSSSL